MFLVIAIQQRQQGVCKARLAQYKIMYYAQYGIIE